MALLIEEEGFPLTYSYRSSCDSSAWLCADVVSFHTDCHPLVTATKELLAECNL